MGDRFLMGDRSGSIFREHFTIMTMKRRVADPTTSERILANLRKARLQMAECNQELTAINEREHPTLDET